MSDCEHGRVEHGRGEKHSRAIDGGRAYWWTERLWQLSADLPIEEVAIDAIPEFDRDCWFGERSPTCRAVALHARRIQEADLSYPVLLASDGGLMDGGHRIAKAFLAGRETVRARRFLMDPEPDWVEP